MSRDKQRINKQGRFLILNTPWVGAVMSLISIPYHYYINRLIQYLWGGVTRGDGYYGKNVPETYGYEAFAVVIATWVVAMFVIIIWVEDNENHIK